MKKRILVFGKKSRFFVSGNMEIKLDGKLFNENIDVSNATKKECRELIGNLSNKKLIRKIQRKNLDKPKKP